VVGASAELANRKWCETVVVAFDELLARSFPLPRTRRAGEARLADVERFFQPANGILWQYFVGALQADIERAGSVFRVKEGASVRYKDDFLRFLVARAGHVEPALCQGSGKAGHDRRGPHSPLGTVFEDRPRRRRQEGRGPQLGRNAGMRSCGHPGALFCACTSRPTKWKPSAPSEDGDWALFRLLGQGARLGGDEDVLSLLVHLCVSVRLGLQVDFKARYGARPVCGLHASTQHHARGCRVSQVAPAGAGAVGCYGKISAQPDFVRINAGAFLRAGLDRWFARRSRASAAHPVAGAANVLPAVSRRRHAVVRRGSCARQRRPWPRLPGGHFRGPAAATARGFSAAFPCSSHPSSRPVPD